MMTKRGLADALRTATAAQGHFPASAYESMVDAVTTLLKANVQAGTVRPDIEPRTILRGLGGLLHLDPHGDWHGETVALIDLLWHGMRT
jgi:hypothetical protein